MSATGDWHAAEPVSSEAFAPFHAAAPPPQGPLAAVPLSLPVADSDLQRFAPLLGRCTPAAAAVATQPPAQSVAVEAVRRLVPVPAFDMAGAAAEPRPKMMELLKHRKAWLPHRQRLPAYKAKAALMLAVRGNRVTVISGEPGVGLTTQVPQLLLEADVAKKKRLIVVSPTHAHAAAAAARLREESGDNDRVIGAAPVAGAPVPPTQQVVYTTALALLKSLACDPLLLDVGAVVVDEAHHRTLATDVLLLALRRRLIVSGDDCSFRVVVCATNGPAAAQGIADFFAAPAGPDPLPYSVAREQVSGEAAAAPTTLHLEAAVAWLAAEGTALPAEASAETDHDVAGMERLRRLGATADFAPSSAWVADWGTLAGDLVAKYMASTETAAAVVVLPTAPHVLAVAAALRARSDLPVDVVAFHPDLCPTAPEAEAATAALYAAPTGARRVVYVVGDSFDAGIGFGAPVGLVLDSARCDAAAFDPASHMTRPAVALLPRPGLKERRDAVIAATSAADASARLVVLLASRDDLAQRARVARSSVAQRTTVEAAAELVLVGSALQDLLLPAVQHSSGNAHSTLMERLLSAGALPAAPHDAALPGDFAARLFNAAVHTVSAAGLAPAATAAAPCGVLPRRVSSLGWIAYAAPFPLSVTKLLVAGTLVGREAQATALAATWLAGGLSQPSTPLEAQDAAAAAAYLSQGSRSDAVAALNAVAVAGDADDLAGSGLCPTAVRRAASIRRGLAEFLVHAGWLASPDSAAAPLTVDPQDALLCYAVTTALYPRVVVGRSSGTAAVAQPFALERRPNKCPVAAHSAVSVPLSSAVADSTAREQGAPLQLPPVSVALSMRRAGPPELPTATVEGVHPTSAALPLLVADSTGSEVTAASGSGAVRCRGWLPPVTDAWRTTARAARVPPAQVKPREVALHMYDPIQSAETVFTADNVVAVRTHEPAAEFLSKLRTAVKGSFVDALMHTPSAGRLEAREGVVEALQWLAQRERGAAAFLRERRQLGTAQPRRQLLPPFPFSRRLHDVPTARGEAEYSRAAAESGDAMVRGDPEEYLGPRPDDQELVHLVDTAAKMVAKAGERAKESELLERMPERFAFLAHRHPFHGYYCHRLRQLAPQFGTLGDDLEEVKAFLEGIEAELREEQLAQRPPPSAAPMMDDDRPPVAAGEIAVEEVDEDAPAPVVEAPRSEMDLIAAALRDIPDAVPGAAPEPAALAPPVLQPPVLEPPVLTPGMLEPPMLVPPPEGSGFGESAPPLMAPPPGMPVIPGMMAGIPPPHYNPLSEPPPPLPIDPNTPRNPSVLVHPLPTRPGHVTDPLPLIMAKALGEQLGIPVGPTLIIGEYARIEVPNKAVENRAIAKRQYFCLGQRLNLMENMRIIDNPLRTKAAAKHAHIRQQLRDDRPRHLRRVEYSPDRGADTLDPSRDSFAAYAAHATQHTRDRQLQLGQRPIGGAIAVGPPVLGSGNSTRPQVSAKMRREGFSADGTFDPDGYVPPPPPPPVAPYQQL